MLIKEYERGDIMGGLGSDPRIGNMLVQGCTNGGLGIESQSRIGVGPMDGPEFGDWSWCYMRS